MFLFLMRHGEATFDSVKNDRFLTARGKADVAGTVDSCSQWLKNLSEIWHSPLQRAVETATIVQENLSSDLLLLQKQELMPNEDVGSCLELIRECDSSSLLVTHMPFIAFLLQALLFPKNNSVQCNFIPFFCSTLVALERQKDNWILCGCSSPQMIR